MRSRVAAIGVILAITAGVAGCGAQQKLEHAVTSARHVVEDGAKVRKQIEQEKPKIEQKLAEFERRAKAAREALERNKAHSDSANAKS